MQNKRIFRAKIGLLLIIFIFLKEPLLAVESLYFQSQDWLVVCDNTKTCRISGYSSFDSESGNISVLLTQKAGVKRELKAEVKISLFDDEKIPKDKLPSFPIEMTINNKSYGYVSIEKAELVASLSQKQITAILTSLKKSTQIVWKTKHNHWQLSDKGAAAVLLKTDEFQHRIGTQGALLKKGYKNESNVIKPEVTPTVYVKKMKESKELLVNTDYKKALEKELILDKDECSSPEGEYYEFSVYKLSSNKRLVSKLCWMGAYNTGSYFWVINKTPPFQPSLITTNGTGYYISDNNIGTISSDHKGRGLGDCWSYQDFVWTGKAFTLSSEGSTGLCRLIAAGGAWKLPTFISKVLLEK